MTASVTAVKLTIDAGHAIRLADQLQGYGSSYVLEEWVWQLAASVAEVPVPSHEVRLAVIAVLRDRATR